MAFLLREATVQTTSPLCDPVSDVIFYTDIVQQWNNNNNRNTFEVLEFQTITNRTTEEKLSDSICAKITKVYYEPAFLS